jgi:hypothetical protein
MNIEEFVVASVMLDILQDFQKFNSDEIKQLQENNRAEEPIFVSSSYDVDTSKVRSSVTGTLLAYPPLLTAWTEPLVIYTLAVVKPEVRTSPVILTDATVSFTVYQDPATKVFAGVTYFLGLILDDCKGSVIPEELVSVQE